jgi:Ca-activated chloride channel family protein
MARVGGGEVEYILLNTPGAVAAKRFYERIASPILTDISLSFSGISLEEVYPAEVSDLWSRKPLVFKARYSKAGKGTVTIRGLSGGKPYQQSLEVSLPDAEKENRALGSLWARSKVDDLMDRDLLGVQHGSLKEDTKKEIVNVALAHRIMTQFTSFVAVEEAVVTVDGKPKRLTVPVEMPDGVSREGIFGESGDHANGVAPGISCKAIGAAYSPVVAGQSLVMAGKPDSVRSRTSLSFDKAPAGARPTRESGVRSKKETETSQYGQRAAVEKTVALAKLSPELRALLKLKKTGDYTEGKVSVREGKVTVQVWISQGAEQIIKKLEQAGLKISFKASTGKAVIGLIEVEKLENLVNLPEVTLVEPLPVG